MSSKRHQGSFLLLRSVFSKSVKSVSPAHRLGKIAVLDSSASVLRVQDRSYVLNHNCYLVGFGKAVLGMAQELGQILGPHLKSGILSVPVGSVNSPYLPEFPFIRLCQGAANNLPDQDAYDTALAIQALIRKLTPNDLLFVALSGGGSALLPCPVESMTLKEKFDIIKALSKSGASINELNVVRKRLSDLKGGKLGLLSKPTPTVAFILSDIIDDPLDLIGSGPTVANTDEPGLAKKVLGSYNVAISEHVQSILSRPSPPILPGDLNHVQNVIIGNLDLALEGMSEHCTENGFPNLILSNAFDGPVIDLAHRLAKLAFDICSNRQDLEPSGIIPLKNGLHNAGEPFALLSGGEPTVHVTGTGKGGRNQELVLRFAVDFDRLCTVTDIRDRFKVFFMSAGTDGIDGPTDAAGAMSDNDTIKECREQGLDLEKCLANNDSYSLLSVLNRGKNLIKVGHTGTNVMDVHCILIQLKK